MRSSLLRRSLVLCILTLVLSAGGAFGDWSETRFPAAASLQGTQWFRCYVRVPDNTAVPVEKDLWRDSIMLQLGGIPGDVSVLLNGQKIIESAALPENQRRRFKVPKGILQ